MVAELWLATLAIPIQNPAAGCKNDEDGDHKNIRHDIHNYCSLERSTAKVKHTKAKTAPKMAVKEVIGRGETKYPTTRPTVVNFPTSMRTVTRVFRRSLSML